MLGATNTSLHLIFLFLDDAGPFYAEYYPYQKSFVGDIVNLFGFLISENKVMFYVRNETKIHLYMVRV